MSNCFAIYLLLPTSWCQISDPDFVTRPPIQTSCSGLWWCIVFVPYTSHLMPGRNHTRYNYLLSTLFGYSFPVLLSGLEIVFMLRLFPLKYELSKTEFTLWWITHSHSTIHQDLASIALGQSRVTSRLSTTRLCYQAHRLLVTTLSSPILIEQ